MKRYLFFVLFTLACNHNQSGKVISLNPDSYEKQLSQTDLVIDVRTPEEFQEGHLYNAINVDFLDSSFDLQISEYKENKKVFIYCRSGKRSAQAAAKMLGLGFEKVVNLKGGLVAWKNEGKVITSD
ncbi:rhodanese-like domain-containing protein [Ascidiimonas sp. W6]|uniref:rhodanese-like domain-containing protein n=1 Tax=Ascidiimonas meishanensis TaxID=3128903 RepID=UPI0030EBAF12